MPSKSPLSTPSPKGGLFHFILAVEIAVLLGLLGVWGYRLMKKNADLTPNQVAAPPAAPAQTASKPAPPRPASKPVRKIPNIKPATNPTPPRTTATAVTRSSSPLPELNSPVILIEKSKQRLVVYDDGRLVKQYPASTGRDAGDKQREGDYRTPEGEFYVCVKNASSKYTRALGLSYPDISAARRGLRDGLITQREHDRIVYAIRNRQQPPWKTPLGGEIMIHGDRRGGRTTQGCIALEDRDILELFPKIPLGTRVIIRP